MPNLNEWEQAVLVKLLQCDTFQDNLRHGDFGLDGAEEFMLWDIIAGIEA